MVKKSLIKHQAAFMQAPYVFPMLRFFFLIAGYAAGKTSSLGDAIYRAIAEFSGKVDAEGNPPRMGVCGITLTFLKKTLVGRIVNGLRLSVTEHNYDKAHNIIYVAGIELHLTPIINEEDIFGFDWCCAFVDELDELPTYKSVAVVKAINDRCRQKIVDARDPFVAFATTSQGLKGTYQVVENFKKKGVGYMIIRARTRDNIFLPREYVESMYKIYSKKEQECLLEGKFVSIDQGLVYPDYDPKNNRIERDFYTELEDGEAVYIGQDFNKGFCKAVAAVCRNGKIHVIKEYDFEDIRRAPEVFRYDFPNQRIRWIPDATYREYLPQFKKELRANRIGIVYRSKNPLVNDRTFLVNKLFYTQRMTVYEGCPELDKAMSQRQNDKKTGLPEKGHGREAPDHIADCLEYMVFYCVSQLKMFRDLFQVTLSRRFRKQVDEGMATERDLEYNLDENEEE